MPPDTTMVSPVIHRASSDARNAATRGDVVRLTEAAERSHANHVGFKLVADEIRRMSAGRFDTARIDRVHPDLARTELLGERPGATY